MTYQDPDYNYDDPITKGVPKKLIEYTKSTNIAEDLDDDQLHHIAYEVINGLREDTRSMESWLDTSDQILKLMSMERETKLTPWKGAANVKIPMITTAVVQYAARAFPEMIKNGSICETKIIGRDDGDPEEQRAPGAKKRKGLRNKMHINWQVSEKMPNYLDNMDAFLHELACVGTGHTKTWYDPVSGENKSKPIAYDQVIVHNSIQNLEDAPRISQYLYYPKNKLISHIRYGLFRDIETDHLLPDINDYEAINHELVEQHCWLDLCNIGFEQPYIVTVHIASEQVLRIVARFEKDDILTNDAGDVKNIIAEQYFTKYIFIPPSDGTYWGYGFGTLLFDLNKTANTTTNMLLNAGYLSTIQGGLLGKGLRLRKQDMDMLPGQWNIASANDGTSLKDNVFPFSYQPPSPILMQLLEFLLDQGKLITSTSEIMSGQGDTQNVSPNTISQMRTEGSKMYSAIERRFFIAFKKDLHKLYKLNSKHIDPQEYIELLGIPSMIPGQPSPNGQPGPMVTNPEYKEMFDKYGRFTDYDIDTVGFGIVPVVDMNEASKTERMSNADMVMKVAQLLIPAQGINPKAVAAYVLDAADIENPQQFIPPNAPPPPNPQLMKVQADAQLGQGKLQLEQQALKIKQDEAEAKINEIHAKTQKTLSDAESTHGKAQLDVIKTHFDNQQHEDQMAVELHKSNNNVQIAAMQTAADVHKHRKDATLKSEENDIKRTAANKKDQTLKD
jgi:hypothetical protein